jgi:hypothetical protein
MTSKGYNYGKPSDVYYAVCYQGYLDFGLDLNYLENTLNKTK